jgi:uncharacterized protein
LDASVLISLFLSDANWNRAEWSLRAVRQPIVISDFAAAEFASGVSQHVRARAVSARNARTVFSEFDEWAGREAEKADTIGPDMVTAATLLRRLDTSLRTPDALHIAIVQRIGAQLMTFGKPLASVARSLGLDVAPV